MSDGLRVQMGFVLLSSSLEISFSLTFLVFFLSFLSSSTSSTYSILGFWSSSFSSFSASSTKTIIIDCHIWCRHLTYLFYLLSDSELNGVWNKFRVLLNDLLIFFSRYSSWSSWGTDAVQYHDREEWWKYHLRRRCVLRWLEHARLRGR